MEKKPKVFVSSIDAGKLVGMSRKKFRRVALSLGIEPVVFHTTANGPKFLYVRARIMENLDRLIAEGKPKNSRAGVRQGPPAKRRVSSGKR